MASREEEIALLAILEQQLGDRHRVMNGIHLDETVAAHTQAAMLRLQEEVRKQAAADASRQARSPRHVLRGRVVRVGLLGFALGLVVLLVMLNR